MANTAICQYVYTHTYIYVYILKYKILNIIYNNIIICLFNIWCYISYIYKYILSYIYMILTENMAIHRKVTFDILNS